MSSEQQHEDREKTSQPETRKPALFSRFSWPHQDLLAPPKSLLGLIGFYILYSLVMIVVAVFGSIALIFYFLPRSIFRFITRRAFDQALWHKGIDRFSMVHNLEKKLKGKPRDEIRALLGNPDGRSRFFSYYDTTAGEFIDAETDLSYFVRKRQPIGWEDLHIVLNEEEKCTRLVLQYHD